MKILLVEDETRAAAYLAQGNDPFDVNGARAKAMPVLQHMAGSKIWIRDIFGSRGMGTRWISPALGRGCRLRTMAWWR